MRPRGKAIASTFADLCRYGIGTRLVDVLKGVERGVRQGRFGSGNSTKLHHTFFIGDRYRAATAPLSCRFGD